jgi:hypothetical protein
MVSLSACKQLSADENRTQVLPGGDYGFAWTPHGTYRDLEVRQDVAPGSVTRNQFKAPRLTPNSSLSTFSTSHRWKPSYPAQR